MNRSSSKFLVILSLFFLFHLSREEDRCLWAAEFSKGQLKVHLRNGIEKGFDLNEEGATAEMKKAVEIDRESPTGYAFLALSHLFFYEMSFEDKEREKNQKYMLQYTEQATEKGEGRLEKNPLDGQAFFALALAKMVKVRWHLTRKAYFSLAHEAQNVWDYIEKVRELDPANYDIYFLMGLLHYHLDHLPGFTRFLSSLLITTGDRQKGLQELEISFQRGELLKEMAQVELASTYANFEKQPARALPLAQDLKKRFPRNFNFSFSLANILSELGRFEEASLLAREIEEGIKSGNPPFHPKLWSRYFHLMGKIHFDQKEYDQAADYCKRVTQDLSPYNARIRVWALVRLGMIHDIRGERKRAEEYYRLALKVEGGEGVAQVAAKQYLESPYLPKNSERKVP